MSFHGILSGNPVMGLFGEGLYNTRPFQRIVARQVRPGDGGTTLEVLAIPLKLAAAHHPPGQLYIIINNILEPAFEVTKPKTLSITAHAFNTLIKSDFYDTILGSYLFAERQGFKFNLAYIPNTLRFKTHELIDPNYMTALFEFGRAQGRLEGKWQHLPAASLSVTPSDEQDARHQITAAVRPKI
jgi:hypothetical protein